MVSQKKVVCVELIKCLLDKGHVVWVYTRGNSMKPLIDPGERIAIRKVKDRLLWVGAIVVFQHSESQIVTHRIITPFEKEGKSWYITKGDARLTPDMAAIPEQRILGEVVAIEKGVKIISCSRYRFQKMSYLMATCWWFCHLTQKRLCRIIRNKLSQKLSAKLDWILAWGCNLPVMIGDYIVLGEPAFGRKTKRCEEDLSRRHKRET